MNIMQPTQGKGEEKTDAEVKSSALKDGLCACCETRQADSFILYALDDRNICPNTKMEFLCTACNEWAKDNMGSIRSVFH
jgi:hypothetical protein